MSDIRILLVGNGGREHALAWKLSQSNRVEAIHVCPGNGGTALLNKTVNVSEVSSYDFENLVRYARKHQITLLVPGPEIPLVDGIVDYFEQHASDILCFGPKKVAAQMEGSKTFSKDFMKRHNIPTAAYENFGDYEQAKRYLDSINHDIVIKADGLAAGKGVILPTTKAEAQTALKEIMLQKEFGSAGEKVVIEELLIGEECSILSLCDGKTIKSFPPAQDHKRIGDGDTGPNTGGMGTYCPADVVTSSEMSEIEKTVLIPTLKGMEKEGMPFVGCLFTGFMMTKNGPRLLEYNVRFGDPETQSVLSLLDSDLAELMVACAKGELKDVSLNTKEGSAATVVVAAKGYPGTYERGTEMTLQAVPEHVTLFHAGTTLQNEILRTSGGRVIASTGTGPSLKAALDRAYDGVKSIHFAGMQYRTDIGHRAFK